MKKNDCFLIKRGGVDESMTVYHITDIRKDKLWAKSLHIEKRMVHGWPTPNEYDNNIPEGAIMLSSDSWEWGKKEMISFINETFYYLRNVAIKEKPQIKVCGHYVGGHGGIHTVTEIGEERIKYREFRLEEDDISLSWTGESPLDTAERWYAISEEAYKETLRRYDDFLSRLGNKFGGL